MTQKHFLKLLIPGLLGLGLLSLFLFFRGGENKKLSNETRMPVSNSESRDVSFVAQDGYKLAGTYWVPDPKKRHPTIILSHQFNSSRHDFDTFIPILLKNGYAVFAYDTRGFGESKNGTANINDFPKDVLGAVEFLKRQAEVDSSRIGIIGTSVGANVAFVVSGSIKEIRAAVALSPSNTGARGVLLGNDILNFSPSHLFIASDEREKSDADFIFGKAVKPKEQHEYPGFGHGIGLLRSDKAQNDILFFLRGLLNPVGKTSVNGNNFSSSIVINNQGGNMDGVFVEIGSVPNSEIVKDLVELDQWGQVVIDSRHASTSHPGIFAAGDITNDPYKQNNISAGDAVKAALAAYNYLLQRQKQSPAEESI